MNQASNTKVAPEKKKEQIQQMFNSIAHRYDFLNHFLSLGIDRLWRKRLVKIVRTFKPRLILDVATGTADLAIELAMINPEKITGVDISEKMLEFGQQKLMKLKLDQKITLKHSDAEKLPFSDKSFDLVAVAFGVRNFENLQKGLKEINRVLKVNGNIAVLEFTMPSYFPVKQLYKFYFKHLLPRFGRWISRDLGAYSYLPESVETFPHGKAFAAELETAGFSSVKTYPLTFGIASIYVAAKS
ncbi:MAG: bifunctional demethylmenaquinone methyltransferase/2-methoxy-6-polyprenyl-1,4-benzoquinol methylase UbiE [Bacteroidales bacterium]|nr:bifunctional demethylmenaquinone methyltransferase/2-methoxy-6-polyprenyl-1,4-benzoquinol methylase UbiE [Bacteroidales bacterium]